uniref:Uncharacterized protein n=1 Tax=Musca domestica TaxID=7370 RepID=A0A1I8N272_MUSDO
MPLTLYYDERSPPVRSVLMLIKMLNIEVDLKEVDLFKREQLREEFLELNPAHTVPVLIHDDLTLTDSHAILIHLCEKYQRDDQDLWPRDYKERLKVLNLLLFSCSVVFRRDSDVMSEIVRKTFPKIDLEYHQRKIHEVYDMMERYLGRNKYLALDKLTIADLSAITTLSTVDLIFPIQTEPETLAATAKWPLLTAWMQRLKELPEYQINAKGLNIFREVLKVYGKFECPTSARQQFRSPKPILYYDELNPQGRSCYMLLRVLQIDVDLRSPHEDGESVDTFRESYPAGVTPTLLEGNLKLCDGHTIMMYLCDKYAAARLPHLYPCDYMARMEIQNMLFYEAGILYQLYSRIMSDIVLEKYANVNMDYHERKVSECYNTLNRCLNGHIFLVGNSLTIADFSIITTVSSLNAIIPILQSEYPNLYRWFENFQNMQCYQFNQQGLDTQRQILETIGEYPFSNNNECSKRSGNEVPFPTPDKWQDNAKLLEEYENANGKKSAAKTKKQLSKSQNCQRESSKAVLSPSGERMEKKSTKCSKYENPNPLKPPCLNLKEPENIDVDMKSLYVKSLDNCFPESEVEDVNDTFKENQCSNSDRNSILKKSYKDRRVMDCNKYANPDGNFEEPEDIYGCDRTEPGPEYRTRSSNRADKIKCVEFRQPSSCPCCMASMRKQKCPKACKHDNPDNCQLRKFQSCLCLKIEKRCQEMCPCAKEKDCTSEEHDYEKDLYQDEDLEISSSQCDQGDENNNENDNQNEDSKNFYCESDNEEMEEEYDSQCDNSAEDKESDECECDLSQEESLDCNKEEDDESEVDNDEHVCDSNENSDNDDDDDEEDNEINTSGITICLCDDQMGKSMTICYGNNGFEIPEIGPCNPQNFTEVKRKSCEENAVMEKCVNEDNSQDGIVADLPSCRCSRFKKPTDRVSKMHQGGATKDYDGVALVCHCDMVDSSCFLCTCEDLPNNGAMKGQNCNQGKRQNFAKERPSYPSKTAEKRACQSKVCKCNCNTEESEDSCSEATSSELASEDSICSKPAFRPSVVCHNLQEIERLSADENESLDECDKKRNGNANKGKSKEKSKEGKPSSETETKSPSRFQKNEKKSNDPNKIETSVKEKDQISKDIQISNSKPSTDKSKLLQEKPAKCMEKDLKNGKDTSYPKASGNTNSAVQRQKCGGIPSKDENDEKGNCQMEPQKATGSELNECDKEIADEEVQIKAGQQKCRISNPSKTKEMSKKETQNRQSSNVSRGQKSSTAGGSGLSPNRPCREVLDQQNNKNNTSINRAIYNEMKSCKRELQNSKGREEDIPQRKTQRTFGRCQDTTRKNMPVSTFAGIDSTFNAGSGCCSQEDYRSCPTTENQDTMYENESFCLDKVMGPIVERSMGCCPQNAPRKSERGCCSENNGNGQTFVNQRMECSPRTSQRKCVQISKTGRPEISNQNNDEKRITERSPQNTSHKTTKIIRPKQSGCSTQTGLGKQTRNIAQESHNEDICKDSLAKQNISNVDELGSPVGNLKLVPCCDSQLESSPAKQIQCSPRNISKKSAPKSGFQESTCRTDKDHCKEAENAETLSKADRCSGIKSRQNEPQKFRKSPQDKNSARCAQFDNYKLDEDNCQHFPEDNYSPRNISSQLTNNQTKTTSNSISCTVSCQIPKLVVDNICRTCHKQLTACRCNTKKLQSQRACESIGNNKLKTNARVMCQEASTPVDSEPTETGCDNSKEKSNSNQKQSKSQCQRSPTTSSSGSKANENDNNQQCHQEPTVPEANKSISSSKSKSNKNAK